MCTYSSSGSSLLSMYMVEGLGLFLNGPVQSGVLSEVCFICL